MNIHEFQAKQLLARFGVAVPTGSKFPIRKRLARSYSSFSPAAPDGWS